MRFGGAIVKGAAVLCAIIAFVGWAFWGWEF